MLLAAGRGERMRPLTDQTPKPLLPVAGKPLLEYHILRLREAGILDLVINHAHLGEQIEDYFGDGGQFGVNIQYSPELSALETGGGIYNALPLLGDLPFMVVNGDVWSDFPLETLCNRSIDLAHLVLVNNPEFNTEGDFCIDSNNQLLVKEEAGGQEAFTFAGISLLSPALFQNCQPGAFPLAPLLREAMRQRAVSGQVYAGAWFDVGTPARLADLESHLRKQLSSGKQRP